MPFLLRSRVRQLEEEIRTLKNEMADRDLAWEEMRARCKRLLDRTEKQYRALESANPPAEEPTIAAPRPETIMPTGDRLARIRTQLAARGKAS